MLCLLPPNLRFGQCGEVHYARSVRPLVSFVRGVACRGWHFKLLTIFFFSFFIH